MKSPLLHESCSLYPHTLFFFLSHSISSHGDRGRERQGSRLINQLDRLCLAFLDQSSLSHTRRLQGVIRQTQGGSLSRISRSPSLLCCQGKHLPRVWPGKQDGKTSHILSIFLVVILKSISHSKCSAKKRASDKREKAKKKQRNKQSDAVILLVTYPLRSYEAMQAEQPFKLIFWDRLAQPLRSSDCLPVRRRAADAGSRAGNPAEQQLTHAHARSLTRGTPTERNQPPASGDKETTTSFTCLVMTRIFSLSLLGSRDPLDSRRTRERHSS